MMKTLTLILLPIALLTGCVTAIAPIATTVTKTVAGQVIAKIALRRAVTLAVDKTPSIKDELHTVAASLESLQSFEASDVHKAVVTSIDWGSLEPTDRSDLRDLLDIVFAFYSEVRQKGGEVDDERYLTVLHALATAIRDGTSTVPASRPGAGGLYLFPEGKVIIR